MTVELIELLLGVLSGSSIFQIWWLSRVAYRMGQIEDALGTLRRLM